MKRARADIIAVSPCESENSDYSTVQLFDGLDEELHDGMPLKMLLRAIHDTAAAYTAFGNSVFIKECASINTFTRIL